MAGCQARRRAFNRAMRYGGMHPAIAEILGLPSLTVGATNEDAAVGWMTPLAHSVKGCDHVCVRCQPHQPAGMVPVYRAQLAARERCGMCRVALEHVALSTLADQAP